MRRAITALLALFVGTVATSQEHPNLERGMSPGKAYQSSEVDSVNLMNGSLNLRLPLGFPYRAGGSLSYGFSLNYATNTWKAKTHFGLRCHPPDNCVETTYVYTAPSETANAGHGWILTLGAISKDGQYVAPDGGEHVFAPTLHANDPAESTSAGVSYSRDGTYLRLTKSATSSALEFPNGHVHVFDVQGRLVSITDPFGNWLNVEYKTRVGGTFAGSTEWKVTDSTGRTHYVYFRPGFSYEDGAPVPNPAAHEIVDSVALAAPHGTTAVYLFDYNVTPPESVPLEKRLSRRCAVGSDPEVAKYVNTSMLAAVRMPEGVTYSMTYDLGDHVSCSANSGNITSLTLPTGGRVDWTYQTYYFPNVGGSSAGDFLSRNSGIKTRKVFDGTTLLSDVEYLFIRPGGFPERYQRRRVINRDAGEIVNATDHYFTVCGAQQCTNRREYGLPFARLESTSPPYLSTEFLVPDANGNLAVQRRTYLEYEADGNLNEPLGTELNLNRRVKQTKTIFEDGTEATVAYSGFDGLGNYRTATTGGTFGRGDIRTTTTNFNESAGAFNVNASGVLTSTFTMPASWLLTTYTTQTVTEPGAVGGGTEAATVAKTSACFDSTGFLTSRRTYRFYGANPAAATTDLLVLYKRDASGNRTREQYFGGDDAAHPAPVNHACAQELTGETHRVEHSHSDGSLERSWWVDANGNSLSHLMVDNEVDANSGLFISSWQASTAAASGSSTHDGLKTTFEYDGLGRLTKTVRAGASRDANVEVIYTAVPPTVEVKELSGTTVLRKTTRQLDALGRAKRETRTMPNGVTSVRDTEYNQLGWRTAASDWGTAGSLSFVRNLYDGFGRVRTTTAPDGKQTTFAYSGIRSVERSIAVRTGGNTTSSTTSIATTKEEYDRQGRLWRVTEPNGVKTDYAHDVGGRLSRVCAKSVASTCGQQRLFEYDAAGLLIKETHPEKGVLGNGATEYRYDARGQTVRRIDGPANGNLDLSFTLDRAARLTKIVRTSDSRLLKEFIFAASNGSSSFGNGKLQTAIRHNWLDVVGFKVAVSETYTYGGREGRVSARTTSDRECTMATTNCNTQTAGVPNRVFEQAFAYDALGNVTTSQFPDCTHSPCAPVDANRSTVNTFDQGWLTGVTWTGAAAGNSISYYANGMIDEVTHGNAVKDKQLLEQHEGLPLSRPEKLTVTGFTDPNNCVKPTFSAQPQSHTVNSGTPVTLQATAAGQIGAGISYAWYIGTAPSEVTPVQGSGNQLSITATETKSFWVKATNLCGSTVSVTATVIVCAEPTISTAPASTSITRGQSAVLAVTAEGSGTLSHQWSTIVNGSAVPIAGATNAHLMISPSATTVYRVTVNNSCGSLQRDATVTVFDAPTAPLLSAIMSNGAPELTWTSSFSAAGISHYEIHRVSDGLLFGGTPPWRDNNTQSGVAYVYKVRAVDIHGAPSDFSNTDLTTVTTFTDLVPVGQPVRGIHIGEMRQVVDAVRAVSGLARAWLSYSAATGPITASAFTEIRDRLNEARQQWRLPGVAFPPAEPVIPGALIRATAITTLRGGTQ